MKKNTKLFLIFIALFLTTLACNRDQFLDLLPEDIIQIETDEPRKISGIVWVDSNMNGRREKDEDYLGGVEVKLYNKDGKVIGSTMTESGSLEKGDNYLITTRRISYGEIFRLEFILPKGYRFTIKSEDRSILGSHVNPEGSNAGFNDWKEIFSESVSGNNAGVVQESWTFIGDYVWHDIDRDGIQDEGELGMEGIIVTLYDAVTGVEIESTITDSNGWYGFVVSDATENSKYQLEFILPDGFLFTEVDVARQETVGINDFLDSDVFPDGVERGWTDVFSAVPGELNDWWDAGLVSIPPTATSTTTPTNTLTFTPTPTPTVTPSATLTPSVTPTPSITPTATWIIEIESEKVDYGDAPLSFPVAAADQGPFIVEPENGFFVYLGADIDSEVAPNIINEDQYDDGLLALNFEKGEAVLQTVASRDILWGTQYYINIVIDFNNNGNWQDEGEWVVQNCDVLPEEIPDSDEPLSTPIIKHCSLLGGFQTIEREGDHWVRVLLSTWKPSGPHWDGSGPEPSKDYIFLGEVEDYRFADVPVSTVRHTAVMVTARPTCTNTT